MLNATENIIHVFTPEERAAASNYWSDERVKKSVPFRMLRPIDPGKVLSPETVGPLPVKRADTSAEPFRSAGKLKCLLNGSYMSGTAQFCGNERLVLTAAHCVRSHETGQWAYNMCFHRAFNGGTSAKNFSVKAVAVKVGWTQEENCYPYDYAFLLLDEKCDTEVLPFRTNDTSKKSMAIGYPDNFDSGGRMQRCDDCAKETALEEPKGIVRLLGTPMQEGCSGGAWLDGKTIVSLNSYRYAKIPNVMYGPLFDEGFQSLYDYALKNL